MTVEQALELAIKVLNEIPNQKTSYGKTYEVLPKLEKALKEKEIGLNTTFGPKWVLGDIIFVAENMDEDITLEDAFRISRSIESDLPDQDEDYGGISNYLIEKKIIAFLKYKKDENDKHSKGN